MISEDVARSMVEQAGGAYVGIQRDPGGVDLILFNDPETESTIACKVNIASVGMVRAKLLKSRLMFHNAKLISKTREELPSDLYLEVQTIRDQAQKLLAPLCTDAEGIENLMHVLSRLDVLIHYLKTR
jgi:uncharacterized protein with GYD domain